MKLHHLFRLVLVLALLLVAFQNVQAASLRGEQTGLQTNTPAAESPALPAAVIISVPGQVPNIQDAIAQIPNGGIIELAPGTYPAPVGGFVISNLHKGFTLRGQAGQTTRLDGGGAGIVLRFTNSNLPNGGPVLFENLVFSNGVATRNGQAGGVTLQNAYATFSNVTFENNAGNQGGAGGGGISVAVGSTAFFFDCVWNANTAVNYGAGMTIGEHSRVFIHNSRFTNNRANLPSHSPVSAGGAIHVGNSTLRVTNTRFEGNQAGYVGGAIYAIGNWAEPLSTPQSDVIVANSTFANNHAARDAGVSFGAPTEGGAFHAEDQTSARIYNTRFLSNSAQTGGAVSLYRASVEIEGGTFLGNHATGSGNVKGFGGAISAVSNDSNDATTGNGSFNRPPARLAVRGALIQGRYAGLELAGQLAGGLYVAGDANRTYGQNGVQAMGGLAENRAVVTLDGVVFNELDVAEAPTTGGTGIGAAIAADLADLTLRDSLVMNSDAIGDGNTSGGGLAIINQSLATIAGSTIAKNSSGKYGGGLFVQGSTINVSGSSFFENSVKSYQYGAAIFTAPMLGTNIPVNGTIQSSLISSNSGLAVFDDDRSGGPINDVRYNGNTFYSADPSVYQNSISGKKTVAQLNDLVVQRSNGTTTDKSTTANTGLGSAPAAGFLTVVPNVVLSSSAAGDPEPLTYAYLAYAWSGGSAALDGQSISGNTGLLQTRSNGTHALQVGGNTYTAGLSAPAVPSASLSLSGTTLTWSLSGGSLLDAGIDQGVAISPAASGSVQVENIDGRSYRFLAVTKEGGALGLLSAGTPSLYAPAAITFLVGQNMGVYRGAIPIANVGGGELTWSASSGNPGLVQVDASSGSASGAAPLPVSINASGLNVGAYQTSIQIDAGAGGSQAVQVTVKVVANLRLLYFPLMSR